MPRVRFASLLVVVLIAIASCSTGTENDSVIEETPSPGSASRGRSDAEPTDVARPQPGKYVYDLQGVGNTAVPIGTQLTEAVEASGDLYTIVVTNNRNENAQRFQLRWEADRVVQLSNETSIGGERNVCAYDPPLDVLHIPMFAEVFDEQQFSNTTCEERIEIEVVDGDSVKDANGKSWDVWVVEIRSEAPGRTDMATRWFSPELGRDIRSRTTTDRGARLDETEQILRSYPPV